MSTVNYCGSIASSDCIVRGDLYLIVALARDPANVASTDFSGPIQYSERILGEELRKAREKAEMTQEDLAFAAKIDRSYGSQLERDLKSRRWTSYSGFAIRWA